MINQSNLEINNTIFTSFYTANGKYPEKAKKLKESLNRFKLKHDIVFIERVFKTWEEAVHYKAQFILDILLKHRSYIVWLDIDSEIWQYPKLLFGENDFAIYNWHADKNHHLEGKIDYDSKSKKLICSGGVQKYGYTAPAIHLLLHWIHLLNQNGFQNSPGDDPFLDFAFNQGNYNLKSLWLPKTYNRMDKHSSFWSNIPDNEVVINSDYQKGNHGDER